MNINVEKISENSLVSPAPSSMRAALKTFNPSSPPSMDCICHQSDTALIYYLFKEYF